MPGAPRRFRSRLVAATLAAVAIAASSVVLAVPASAHFDLLATDPAADSVVTAAPETVGLTFSGNLLADDGATVVEVIDSSGADLAEGSPAVEGAVVTQAVAGASDGTVTVRWKVVYEDGHTGSGEFAFTVDSPVPTPTRTSQPFPTPTQTIAPGPTESPTPTASPSPAPATADPLPWLIGAGVLVLAVAGAITYLAVSRSRRERGPSASGGTGSEPPAGG